LINFAFIITKDHLRQARDNHAKSNWAGANSQFRPFIESLLIDISKNLLPDAKCDNAAAIKVLNQKTDPPFLSADLNEVERINLLLKGCGKGCILQEYIPDCQTRRIQLLDIISQLYLLITYLKGSKKEISKRLSRVLYS
jgi:hypothetical protein